MSKPRVILWDIERTHNLVTVFDLKHNDYIGSENIVQESYIPCAAWKVLGETAVHATSTLDDPKRFKKDHHDDFHVVKTLHEVLSAADVLIGHNSDAFDLKFTEGRMLFHKLPPLPPIAKIDTLKAVRNRFLLNANNLNYLGKYLNVGEKIPTEPGLWFKVLAGDKAAIKRMIEYNKGDVVLLEKVFLRLQPFIDNHVNRQLHGETGCPRCGSLKVQSRGVHRALTQVYQRYCCNSCGGWFRALRAEKGSRTASRVL